jgi:hypothetical protein
MMSALAGTSHGLALPAVMICVSVAIDPGRKRQVSIRSSSQHVDVGKDQMEGFQNCNGGICIVGEYGEDHVTGTHRFRLTVESKGAGATCGESQYLGPPGVFGLDEVDTIGRAIRWRNVRFWRQVGGSNSAGGGGKRARSRAKRAARSRSCVCRCLTIESEIGPATAPRWRNLRTIILVARDRVGQNSRHQSIDLPAIIELGTGPVQVALWATPQCAFWLSSRVPFRPGTFSLLVLESVFNRRNKP